MVTVSDAYPIQTISATDWQPHRPSAGTDQKYFDDQTLSITLKRESGADSQKSPESVIFVFRLKKGQRMPTFIQA
jgi:hypothetical protein